MVPLAMVTPWALPPSPSPLPNLPTPHILFLLQIQVCSNPLVVENTMYALEVAKNVIMFYEREFDVAYPLPKQGSL